MVNIFYDETANGYNELYGEEQLKKIGLIKRTLKLKKSDSVLDVGCGTGLSEALGCEVIGIDPAAELLRQANMPVARGVAEHLPFKNESFDAVICITAIHNFDDVAGAIKEMKRVSRDRIVISLLKVSEKFSRIKKQISQELDVKEVADEFKDTIFFCSKKKYI